MIIKTRPLLSALLFSLAVDALVVKRDVCDWKGAEPILYQQYWTDSCPPIKKLQPDGNCELDVHQSCANFCQIRTNYLYGQEQPFTMNPYCHGPMTCTIQNTVTETYSWSVNIPVSVKLQDIFSVGVTGGVGGSTARAVAKSYSVKLDDNQCGYFTFLPIIKEACGTWTEGTVDDDNGNVSDLSKWKCVDVHSTGNVCSRFLQDYGDGGWFSNPTARGDTIFVKTDCGTRAPLPNDQQDLAYQHDGVALPRAMYDGYAQLFSKGSDVSALTSSVSCATGDGSPSTIDCQNAISTLTQFPQVGALHGKQGGKWWAGYVNSCAIQIDYEQDWDDSCDVNLAEVLGAANGIMDTCVNNDIGKVTGSRSLRNDGKCNAQVSITATNGIQPPQGQ